MQRRIVIFGIISIIIIVGISLILSRGIVDPNNINASVTVTGDTYRVSGMLPGSAALYAGYKTKTIDHTLFITVYSSLYSLKTHTAEFNIVINDASKNINKIVLDGGTNYKGKDIWSKK